MKNFSIILNIILLVAVTLLYVDRFANRKNNSEQSKIEIDTTNGNTPIVFVNLDTLLNDYAMYNDLMLEFYDKKGALETQLKNKYAALERKSAELQQQYDSKLITTAKAQEKQQELYLEQQQITEWQQTQTLALAEDEADITKRVYDSIQSVLKNYNSDSKHKLIISNSYGGVLLHGDQNLDITTIVLDKLNKKYNKSSLDTTK